MSSLTITVTRDDGDEGAGVSIESEGYTGGEILEALLRVTESIVQHDLRDNPLGHVAELPRAEYEGILAIQARLLIIDTLTSLDFVASRGASMEL